MLFFILLLKGLIIAAAIYCIGAAVALGLWIFGLLTKLKIPAFIRWGVMGVVLAVVAFGTHPQLLNEPGITAEDWRSMAEGVNKVSAGLACAALVVTGFILSLTKLTVKATMKGVAMGAQALSSTEGKRAGAPPPLP